jgi:hypothetical protein
MEWNGADVLDNGMKLHYSSLSAKIVVLCDMGVMSLDKSKLALEVDMALVEVTTCIL